MSGSSRLLCLAGPVSSRRIHASNTERGGTFQLLCRDALNKALSRNFDLEVRIRVGNGKPHNLDLATRERDIVAECKAFAFIMMRRNATVYLRSMRDVQRALIVKAPTSQAGETLAQYYVRLNPNFLDGITLLEMPETGGELVCISGSFKVLKPVERRP